MEHSIVFIGDSCHAFQYKNPNGNAENEVSKACYTPQLCVMKISPAQFHRNFKFFSFPRNFLQAFSNNFEVRLSVEVNFVPNFWSLNICVICGSRKISSLIWPHLFWEMFALNSKSFALFIRRNGGKKKNLTYALKQDVPHLY